MKKIKRMQQQIGFGSNLALAVDKINELVDAVNELHLRYQNHLVEHSTPKQTPKECVDPNCYCHKYKTKPSTRRQGYEIQKKTSSD